MLEELDGLLLLDKPTGPTSHDLVQRVRRGICQRRVGHLGTLDPMASGLLPLVLGRATRLARFLPQSPKLYTGELRLGLTTDTDDVTGETLSRHDGSLPPAERVLAEARSFEGRQLQVPPSYSARKVGGERMYRLARRGVRLQAPPAEVEVSRFELVATDEPDLYAFTAKVTGGTYIRSLARDLGARLGCGGTLAALARVAIGPMDLASALAPRADGSIDRAAVVEALIPPEQMPLDPPELRLEQPDEAIRFTGGAAVVVRDDGSKRHVRRVLHPDGTLLGVAELDAGLLRPRVVLRTRATSPGRLAGARVPLDEG